MEKRFREIRESKHLTRKELACKLGKDESFVADLEEGKVKDLSCRTVYLLAVALGVSVCAFWS